MKFCFKIINNASITKKMRFLNINGFIMETCICMDSLIISLHGNVNNSKFIKKNTPESRPATPLKKCFGNSHTLCNWAIKYGHREVKYETFLPRCSETTTWSNVFKIGGNMHRDFVYCMKLILKECRGLC